LTDDPYVYPGTTILINKLGIKNKAELELVERGVTVSREQSPMPGLVLDETGFRGIHGHLFEPLYEWAGQYRNMNMAVASVDELGRERKVVFAPQARIEPEMREVFSRLRGRAKLNGISPDRFAGEAAYVAGRLLQSHPFRDGNRRTTRYFIEHLALQAGHRLSLSVAPAEHVRARWMAASEEIFRLYPNYTPMT
jgi:cell filamentation protein